MSPSRPQKRENRASRARPIHEKPLQLGGEGGIRTPGTDCSAQRFSRPPHSAALPPLRAARIAGIEGLQGALAIVADVPQKGQGCCARSGSRGGARSYSVQVSHGGSRPHSVQSPGGSRPYSVQARTIASDRARNSLASTGSSACAAVLPRASKRS